MSGSRKTRRLPLCVFYGRIKISLVNAHVLHVHNMARKSEKVLSRNTFTIKLSEDLLTPWMKNHLNLQTLSRSTRIITYEVLNLEKDIQSAEQFEYKKGKFVHFAHIIGTE
ncbi:hypothetical protein NPIL_666531 [Nephila pilipes]|uniref:Uncharacterized protein n=1 Tax=Nephila pilipes TaxID=299642 RepID=A0A8X6N342_NEPPI|nr:hypothetical protein NPIL_666531 [Nephila pilipes]